jgi:hypothetical protein
MLECSEVKENEAKAKILRTKNEVKKKRLMLKWNWLLPKKPFLPKFFASGPASLSGKLGITHSC